jgi:ATP-dependent protease HslVU (ClpYQ) peptidase subunit
MIASDSAVTLGSTRVPTSPKLFRDRHWLVGMAGNVSNFAPFLLWLRNRETRMPAGVTALLLYRTGQIGWFMDGPGEQIVPDDFFAIGSGFQHALGALDAMADMGLPLDPRVAVRAACKRDTGSAEPVLSLRWKT